MKVLCICEYGHSRSVALARVLHGRKIPAVAIGRGTSGDAVKVLAEWADKIIVLQPCFAVCVPAAQQHKVIVFDVGHDRWSNPYNQELLAILGGKVEKEFGKVS